MQINGTCTRDSDCPQQDDKCLISYCSDGECKVQPKVPKRVFCGLSLLQCPSIIIIIHSNQSETFVPSISLFEK